MTIEDLREYNPVDVQDMDRLMHELSSTSFCNEEILDAIMADSNSHLYVTRDDSQIIGCACLCIAHSPEFTLGFVESVTVLSSYRGKGIGRQLMEHLMAEAKRFGCVKLHLTSNPRRVAANALYQKLGFQLYNTNCYQMEL